MSDPVPAAVTTTTDNMISILRGLWTKASGSLTSGLVIKNTMFTVHAKVEQEFDGRWTATIQIWDPESNQFQVTLPTRLEAKEFVEDHITTFMVMAEKQGCRPLR